MPEEKTTREMVYEMSRDVKWMCKTLQRMEKRDEDFEKLRRISFRACTRRGVEAVNPWVLLSLAIGAEAVGTTCLKFSKGFTETLPLLGVAVGYGAAFYLMSLALTELELGVVYAVWAGAGTALIALIGVAAFGDTITFAKTASLLCIIAGVVGLHVSGASG